LKTYGFAVIGCGTIAEFHRNAIRNIEQARLVAIADRKEARAREIAEQEGCSWTTDYREVLRNPSVDIVCITTGSGSHAAIGLEALEAGKHLFVEKPLAMTSVEAKALIQLAKQKGLTLSIVSQRRFEEQHQAAYQAISQGRIGKLLLVELGCPYYRTQAYYDSAEWRGTVSQDGGALMNQGIHSIDLMLWMAGEVEMVYGKTATQTHQMEAEDLGLALLKFKNGAFGTIMSSTSIQPGFAPYLHIYGEHGSIKLEGTGIKHWSVPGVEMPEWGQEETGGGVSDPRNIPDRFHRLQLLDMLEALESGRDPLVTGIDGWNSVRLIETIYTSSALGKEINMGEERL
jgi:UDP-N-acetyl-2-amino-2-deoxyglucuronate dehydrogenase